MRIVHRVEDLTDPVPNATYVVIDVYRFSTTVAYLIAAGVKAIHPFADPDAARTFKQETGARLFGERGGEKLPGFDHNNSPSMIPSLDLAGETVGICTTNGTRALDRVRDNPVVIGSTVNAAAVATHLHATENDIVLLATGTEGAESPEDVVGAELISEHYAGEEPSDAALAGYRARLQESFYADRLRRLGHGADVDAALRFNAVEVVPRVQDGVIH